MAVFKSLSLLDEQSCNSAALFEKYCDDVSVDNCLLVIQPFSELTCSVFRSIKSLLHSIKSLLQSIQSMRKISEVMNTMY